MIIENDLEDIVTAEKLCTDDGMCVLLASSTASPQHKAYFPKVVATKSSYKITYLRHLWRIQKKLQIPIAERNSIPEN